MNHPSPEELTDLLYNELSSQRQTEVTQHLESCAECRAQVESWRGVRGQLASWKVPEASPRPIRVDARGFYGSTMRWAVAAVVLLASGFGLARLTGPASDSGRLRAELAGQIRAELRQELAGEMERLAAIQVSRQQVFERAVNRTLSLIETRRVEDCAALRTDVETVAVRTQEEFNRLTGLEGRSSPARTQ